MLTLRLSFLFSFSSQDKLHRICPYFDELDEIFGDNPNVNPRISKRRYSVRTNQAPLAIAARMRTRRPTKTRSKAQSNRKMALLEEKERNKHDVFLKRLRLEEEELKYKRFLLRYQMAKDGIVLNFPWLSQSCGACGRPPATGDSPRCALLFFPRFKWI